MLAGRGARAGRGMPRGWTALCLLSLLLREYRLRARAAGWVLPLPWPSAQSPRGAGGKGPRPPPTPHAHGGSRLRLNRGPLNRAPLGAARHLGSGGVDGQGGGPPPPGSAPQGARPRLPGVGALRLLGVVSKVKRFEDCQSLFAWLEVQSAKLEPEPGEGRREEGKFCVWELIPKAQA